MVRQQISQVYHAALQRDPRDRAGFLREACGGDDTLHQEVASLLANESHAAGFLSKPALAAAAGLITSTGGTVLAGRCIGVYQVQILLGAGGMGEVYRARDTKLGRDVAFKILPRAFTADPDRLARFEREARVLASLNHPHIGAIYGLEESDGVRALVLELVDGETLADRLATGALPLDQALTIAMQIASALDTAHRAGIIHRDLKPGNIMLTRTGSAAAAPVAKLLDFGLSKALAVRSFDAGEAQVLPGTEGGFFPFWSPDGRFIGFFAEGTLKKIDVTGGPPLTLCDASEGVGGSWNRDGTIVFAPNNASGLFLVSAAGGAPAPVTALDGAKKERSHRWPWFLPDGRRFLYVGTPPTTVYVGSLDSDERTPLFASESQAIYADRYLLFIRQGTLLAQSFDPGRLRTMGESFRVTENVTANPEFAAAAFSASTTGVLTYRTGGQSNQSSTRTQLTWVDRAGNVLGAIGQPGPYRNPELSPDGSRVAVNAVDPQGRTLDIWLVELARGVTSRFTFDPGNDVYPVWSPDGSRIVFGSDRVGGVPHLYQKRADGVGIDEPVLKSSLDMLPHGWSPDGRFLAYRTPVNGRSQIGILPLVGEQTPHWFAPSRFVQFHSQVSPDGRWLAYGSDESGRFEIYVQSFPAPGGGKWQISKDGGWFPRWRRDGRELFYYARDERLMAVPVRSATGLDVGAAELLFEMHLLNGPANAPRSRHQYDVARDGQRFLLNVPFEDAAASSITVVLNWTAGLKK